MAPQEQADWGGGGHEGKREGTARSCDLWFSQGSCAVRNTRAACCGRCLFHCLCVGSLTAECSQINPEKSASSSQAPAGPGRTETAVCCHVSGNLMAVEDYSLLIYLAVSLLCFSCPLLRTGREGKVPRPLFFQCHSLLLCICSKQAINPTTTSCDNNK